MNSDQNYEKSLERGLRVVDQLSAVVSMIFLTIATSTIVAIIFYVLRGLGVPKNVAVVLIIFVGLWLEIAAIRGTILYWKDKHPKTNSISNSAN